MQESINQKMKVGDRVIITKTNEEYKYFSPGDKATLVKQDADGDWWAFFDTTLEETENRFWCIQKGVSECILLTDESL